jgi:hypothetical protein
MARHVLSLIRVSGKSQIDRTGIPRQLEDIATICKAENLVVAPGDEYRFEGLSGASVESFPKYREMLSRLSDPRISGIVFSEVSRLFRPEFPDQLSVSKPFRVNGKLMFYADGVLDLRKEKDQGIFYAEAQQAGAHRKRIVKWTHWGKNQRRKEGNCKTDPLPAGVRFVQHPSANPNELPTGHFEYTENAYRIKEAFRLIVAGTSLAETGRKTGFVSHTRKRPNTTLLRLALSSRWWIQEKSSVNLRVGRKMRDDGTLFDGNRIAREDPIIVKAAWKEGEGPLVSREDFLKAQEILNGEKKHWVQSRGEAHSTLEPFLGHGVVYCECGGIMYPKVFKRRHCESLYYLCSKTSPNYHHECKLPIRKHAVVDQEIKKFAMIRLINTNFLKSLEPVQPVIDTGAIEKQLTKLLRQKEAQYRRIGTMRDEDLLMKLIGETETQIETLEKELRNTRQPVTFDPAALRQKYLDFGNIPLPEQKELIRSTFSKITVDAEGSIIGIELRDVPGAWLSVWPEGKPTPPLM